MLTHFMVSNFKSIKHLELEIHPFMVLVGPNGAGKTNIVQAIELLGSMLDHGSVEPVRELGYDEVIRREKKPARGGLALGATFRTDQRSLMGLYARADATSAPLDVTVAFVIRGSIADPEPQVAREELTIRRGATLISFVFDAEDVEVNLSSADPELIEFARTLLRVRTRTNPPSNKAPSANSQFASKADEFKERLREFREDRGSSWLAIPRLLLNRSLWRECLVQRLRLDASTLRRDALTKERYLGFIGPAGEGLALAVDRLRGHGKAPSAAFVDLMQQLHAVYPRIEDIEAFRVQPGRLVLRFKERGIDEQLGHANVSDGVLHALALLLALSPHLRIPGVVVIEEPENAIHPWPLRQIIEAAQQRKAKSLIITTHSATVVDAIADPTSLFVVEQTGEKGTTVVPARDKEQALDAILRESGKRLGEIWLEGGIGGVPTTD